MADGLASRFLRMLTGALIVSTCGSLVLGADPANRGAKPAGSSELKEVVVTGKKVVPDEVLTERVEQALHTDPLLYAEHVTITTRNGVVHIEGMVSDAWDLWRVLRDARRVAGVKRVVQELDMMGDMSDGPGW